jgi:hypothetical protein
METAIEDHEDGTTHVVCTDIRLSRGYHEDISRCYSSNLRCIICDEPVYCREVLLEEMVNYAGDIELRMVHKFFHDPVFGLPRGCELLPNLNVEIGKALLAKYPPTIHAKCKCGRTSDYVVLSVVKWCYLESIDVHHVNFTPHRMTCPSC